MGPPAGVTASRPPSTGPPRSLVWAGLPATRASAQLGRRPAPGQLPQARGGGGLDAGVRPRRQLLTALGGPRAAVVAGTAVAPRAPASSRHTRPRPRDEPGWLQLTEGAPGRAEGLLLPGPGCLLRGPGLGPREGAAIRLCCVGALETGWTPPSWQGLSHRDAPAPGLGDCCILPGSPGPEGWASHASEGGGCGWISSPTEPPPPLSVLSCM